MRGGDAILAAAVAALWLAAVALVGIGGDFPLSDDWAYAHVVRSLCEGRGFDFLPWTGASLVAQALYGAAACALAGFSHEVLRATTLVLSAVGVVSFHGLLRALGADFRTAAAGAAVLAFSPLWFNLSFTFMTDVPFAALAIASAWLYAAGLRRESRRTLLAAGAVAAVALLVRQHAIWIAVAAGVAACLAPPREAAAGHRPDSAPGTRLVDAAAALALPLATAAAYALWAATSAQVPLAVQNKLGEALVVSPLAVADAAFRALATLGFLFAPWALTLGRRSAAERRMFVAALAILAGAAAFLYAREGAAMFYLTNVLGELSVGAITTRDVLFLGHPSPFEAGPLLRLALTVVSLASAAALVARLATALPSALGRGRREAVFCTLALVLSALGTLLQAHYYFDRYLVVLLPLAVASIVALSAPPRPGWGMAAALALLSYYAVAGTHDYMQWNRARWELLASLEASGVTARQVDGGVEYNASRLAAELGTAPTDAQARSGQPASARSWWWVVDDEWIVAFGPLDGYAEVDSRRFARWLPPGEGLVRTLRRTGEAQ